MFQDHVTNTTRFLLPREFETPDLDERYQPPKKRSTKKIALCCGSGNIIPNAFIFLSFSMLAFFLGSM